MKGEFIFQQFFMNTMGRVIASVSLENLREPSKSIQIDALVDTGSAYMVLPSAWKSRLGKLDKIRDVQVEAADHSRLSGEVCGPVKLKIPGFDPIYTEVLFINMQPEDGTYEPLLGYIPLEQSQAAVDMLSHRLIKVKYVDLKRAA